MSLLNKKKQRYSPIRVSNPSGKRLSDWKLAELEGALWTLHDELIAADRAALAAFAARLEGHDEQKQGYLPEHIFRHEVRTVCGIGADRLPEAQYVVAEISDLINLCRFCRPWFAPAEERRP